MSRSTDRKKILRYTLQNIFDFYHENKKLKYGGLSGAYNDRREKYRQTIRELYNEKGEPLTKEEVAPYRAMYRIDDVYDKYANETSWREPLCKIFDDFYESARGITGQQIRERITTKDIGCVLVDDSRYDDLLAEANSLLGLDKGTVAPTDLIETMEKIRLEYLRDKLVPSKDSFYVVHSPIVRNNLGEEPFSEIKELFFQIKEYDLAEFNSMMLELEYSLEHNQEIVLKSCNPKKGVNHHPTQEQKNIAYLHPESVFKINKEYSVVKKDWSKNDVFSSEFERKLNWFLHDHATVHDTFSGTWKSFNDFVVSVFFTYFEYTKNLNIIKICPQCGKIFIYKNSKSKFCNDKCKNNSHRKGKYVKCYNRQRLWFKKCSEVVEDYCRSKNIPENKIPSFKSIEQRLVCSGGECPHKFPVSTGYCKAFLEKNTAIVELYKIIKK
jgi:hypothetical protein